MKQLVTCLLCVMLLVGCEPNETPEENPAPESGTVKTEPVQVEAPVQAEPAKLAPAPASPAVGVKKPTVKLTTSMGTILIELEPDKAPITVENFLEYVRSGFYKGTIFHRVMPDFMIQGGGFGPTLQEKATRPPIKNEAANGLKNLRGTIAMARTNMPDSATSQFFINHRDNPPLDFRGLSSQLIGYAVFGRVVSGMDVVDRIAMVPTGSRGPYGDVPVTPVMIESAEIVNP